MLATLSNNISAWNQCRTLNSSFHCSFRGSSGPQFYIVWLLSVKFDMNYLSHQLARWRPSMRMCPILTSTTSQGAIFIISPILHNLTSITFQGAILCGHNFPIHPILMCYQPRFELQGGVRGLDPLLRAKLPGKSHFSIWRWLNLSIWRWLKWVTKMTTNSRSNNHRWLSE